MRLRGVQIAMIVLGACAGPAAKPGPATSTATATPSSSAGAAAPAELRLELLPGVEQAVPGTDVKVTLVRTRGYEPSVHEERVTVEPVWPEAWLRLRRGDQVETVEWEARGGWNEWGGRRWKVALEGDGAVVTVAAAP